MKRLKTTQELRAHRYTLEQIRSNLDGAPANAIAEAARLEVELDQMLGTIRDLKGAPLDAKVRSILNPWRSGAWPWLSTCC